MRRVLVLAAALLAASSPAGAQTEPAAPGTGLVAPALPASGRVPDRYLLVEEFTADTMAAGEVKLGTDLEVGLTDHVMIGTDLVSAMVGAATLEAKFAVWRSGEHQIALGLRGAYLNRKTLFWGAAGGVREHYAELDARVIRPSISWTNTLSPRLKLHTFWAKGFGRVHAALSETGQRALWEAKHPGADYDDRNQETQQPAPGATTPTDKPPPDDTSTSENQEKAASDRASPTQQTIQVQSITGLAQERFQLTGEFNRASGNKVLVTSRIEQTRIEELKTNFFRLTAAHQWIWPSFQIRLGLGAQYFVMSGKDLDSEHIDESGWQPASDIAFYWRF